MENTKVNIFVVDHQKNTYVLEVPENMTYLEFTNLITKKISTINELRNYHAIFKEKNFNKNSFIEKMHFENDHISVARRHEKAIQDFKRYVEAICDCPKPAREAKDKEEQVLIRKKQALEAENEAYDVPGGPHVPR